MRGRTGRLDSPVNQRALERYNNIKEAGGSKEFQRRQLGSSDDGLLFEQRRQESMIKASSRMRSEGMDGFDMKSQKPKNKRNFNKANDYNADKYDQSATQSNIMFDKKGPSVLYKKYCRK